MKFQELKLSEKMHRALTKLDFADATPVQEQAIKPMLQKHDLLVQSPTGSGKTAAFGIPVIEGTDFRDRSIQTIILSPTRELALQTTKVLQDLALYMHSIRIVSLYGGEPIGRQISALRKNPQIIVATPGRLMDHIQRRTVKLGNVSCVVMDEADRMLDMGFRDDMDTILKSVPKPHQTVLFSATLSPEILAICKNYQTDPIKIKLTHDVRTVDSVEQFYIAVAKGGKDKLAEKLLRERQDEQSLVFVGTKNMADALAEQLKYKGIRAEALHGGLRQIQRDRVMSRFRKGEIKALIATDVAARGIDVSGMGTVINYDIPQTGDDYVHRIGRTGRANAAGVAYTFVYAKEAALLRHIMKETGAPIKPLTVDIMPKTGGASAVKPGNFPKRPKNAPNASRPRPKSRQEGPTDYSSGKTPTRRRYPD